MTDGAYRAQGSPHGSYVKLSIVDALRSRPALSIVHTGVGRADVALTATLHTES